MKEVQLSMFPGIPGYEGAKYIRVSRSRSRKEYETPKSLSAFKSKHLIYTHRSRSARPEWSATKLPLDLVDPEDKNPSSAAEIMAAFGAIVEERGYYAEGKTEKLAVLNLCQQIGIETKGAF